MGVTRPVQVKFLGPPKKAKELGLVLFLFHPLRSCRLAWVAILWAAHGHTKLV